MTCMSCASSVQRELVIENGQIHGDVGGQLPSLIAVR